MWRACDQRSGWGSDSRYHPMWIRHPTFVSLYWMGIRHIPLCIFILDGDPTHTPLYLFTGWGSNTSHLCIFILDGDQTHPFVTLYWTGIQHIPLISLYLMGIRHTPLCNFILDGDQTQTSPFVSLYWMGIRHIPFVSLYWMGI